MDAGRTSNHWVRSWLLAGVVMVFFQIIIGGVTRLTGSGLSITRWEIVTGTVPPLNAADWQLAFEDYKATPQYQKINAGMSLSRFKFIYFWEYIHRLWARSMGVVFLFPFAFFLWKGWLSRKLVRRLSVVILLAGLAATFGWIMVASGLIDRPWVNAYKLTIHLLLGTTLLLYLAYTWLGERGYERIVTSGIWRRRTMWLVLLTVVQLSFGGLMSGMKAALNYPTWPLMHGKWIPEIVWDRSHWNMENFLLYDQSGFMPALVQVIHRHLAYVLVFLAVLYVFGWIKDLPKRHHAWGWGVLGIILAQATLGIITVMGSRGSIPVFYGSLHQGVGILLIAILLTIYLKINTKQID